MGIESRSGGGGVCVCTPGEEIRSLCGRQWGTLEVSEQRCELIRKSNLSTK